ncbi:SpoIIE family protein phosphatase [Streptomyces sp. NPDC051569]|uniref:ATP-binding SpoIIE family protein phosphatase n=1 Tax=Streptomyces sp. NPDC051569 TaxID=3365661 RepID=UPI0037A9F1B2
MRPEDVLAAIGVGLWEWDSAADTVALDPQAARLLELPEGSTDLPAAAVFNRVHPVDRNTIDSTIQLAFAEGTLAESRMRVINEAGEVIRTIRTRGRPYDAGTAPSGDRPEQKMAGSIHEVIPSAGGDGSVEDPVTADRRRTREAFLLDAGRALAEAHSTAEVLRVAASLSMPDFPPGTLAVYQAVGDRLKVTGYSGDMPDELIPFTDLPLDTNYPAVDVIHSGEAIYLSGARAYRSRYPAAWQYAGRFGRGAWAFVPLTVGNRTLGVWRVAFNEEMAFTFDERVVLTTVARMLAQSLARAGVTESERQLALGLQRSMMPTTGPEIPGMTAIGRYVPTGGSLQVGGDWYDMIPLPGGSTLGEDSTGQRFALVIGDVEGHDVRAAGLMAALRIALRAYASEGHRPDAVLARASRFLTGLQPDGPSSPGQAGYGERPSGDGVPVGTGDHPFGPADAADDAPRFATCLYVEVNPQDGTLDVARAGHPDLFLLTTDGTALVRPTAGGLPLGVEADVNYPTTQLTLEPGETLMLCTDGLIEAVGRDYTAGAQRLQRVMEEHGDRSADQLADALVGNARASGPYSGPARPVSGREDDIALLLLARDKASVGAAGRAPRRTVATIAQAEPERIAGARRQVRDLLQDWADEERVDSAELMVSEMVTNVLVHTDGDALLVAEADGEPVRRLRVEVADSSDELPHRRSPGELASSGRGLVLMEVLADAWGADPRGEGKSIWFELYEDGGGPESSSDPAPGSAPEGRSAPDERSAPEGAP